MDWVVMIVGIIGFWLAGKKIWWAWYVNIFNQILWTVYAILFQQWGFLAGTAFYLIIFIKNAISWTKEHLEEKRKWRGVNATLAFIDEFADFDLEEWQRNFVKYKMEARYGAITQDPKGHVVINDRTGPPPT